jgi:drug/metabolite transporter (DMT)-like permease
MWGTDPLFRQKLALNMPASAIVAFEQALPALLLAPFVWRGIRRARAVFDGRDWLALVVLGCGSSALATLLFTLAFTYDRPNTPVLLQQLQPLFAVAGARVVLGERFQHRYGLYLLGGLAGAYLIAFPHPFSLGGVDGWAPALLSVTAAGLWGFGTVLGRRLGAKLPFTELTALRLATGLVAALIALGVTGDGSAYAHVSAKGLLALVLLALVPGLLSLLVYYRGLRATPAAAATLGELAFPLTALVLDYLAFGAVLSGSQWLGLGILVATITTMGALRANGTPTGVEVPQLEALSSPTAWST